MDYAAPLVFIYLRPCYSVRTKHSFMEIRKELREGLLLLRRAMRDYLAVIPPQAPLAKLFAFAAEV